MRKIFRIPTFLPTNRILWVSVTLLLFALLWIPPLGFLDFCKEFFNEGAGGGVVEGIRVVAPISLILLSIVTIVAWSIQGVAVEEFRRLIYPKLERRYGSGVTLSYIVNPRRLWATRSFRCCVFAFSGCLVLILSLCTFFRVWTPRDFVAYRGMAAECHPVWRAFAFRQFSRGDATTAMFAKYPPTVREEFGRYGIYSFYQGNLKNGIPFTGLTVIARDGRLITAAAGSCTWRFTFFETEDPQLEKDYKAYMQERERRQTVSEETLAP